jgi:Ca2+-dependent lipid-binding protein
LFLSSDPYVKLYLLPDRSKKSKKKSDAKKDTVDPVYNESFTYNISASHLGSRKLEVSVVDRKGLFSRRALMGRVVIGLADAQVVNGNPNWFLLEEADETSD